MQISKIFLLSVAIGIGLAVGITHTSAQQENITFEELEIIPDPNRENLYTYIFNVCDNNFAIEDPKIMVISDMEKKPLQLNQVFNSDECFGAVEKIRAKDPDSIVTKLITFELKETTDAKEKAIEDLKILQVKQQKELRETLNEKFPEGSIQEHKDKVREISDRLYATQKLLQDKTAQYYTMQDYHHPDDLDE
jgi:hypothetical protein